MKTTSKFLLFPFIVLTCSLAMGLSVARASDDDGEQGGDIQGTESMDIDIALTPTAAAPAGSSIKGQLEADDEDGTTSATLKLEPQGLPAGTYSVSVTLKSDGSTVQLGSFAVGAAGTNGDDDGVDDGQGDQSGDDQETDDGQGEVEFGNDTSIPFPANFNAFDIATISVSDANNVVLFTADLTNTVTASSMNISANVQAKGGPGNPSATGSAVLTAVNTHGKVKGSLQLSGRGLLPSTPLTVAINGIAAKKVNSDKSGNVKVLFKANGKTATLASGVTLFKVTSVSLRDKLGNVVLTASF